MFNRFRPGDPITFFQHLADTYGPIAHYKIGPEHIVFINDPELIKEVLITQHANFVKERTQDRMKILVGEGLITSNGAYSDQTWLEAQKKTNGGVGWMGRDPTAIDLATVRPRGLAR